MVRLLLLISFFLVGCEKPSQKSMRASTLSIQSFDLQGHRGARGLVPENTVAAFIRALDIGVTTLEMDAVISADHDVILSHEPWMSAGICSHPNGQPVTEEEEPSLRLYHMTSDEIATFDCGSRGNPAFPEQTAQPAHKPKLVDVIHAVNEHVSANNLAYPRYNIEIKSSPKGDNDLHPPVWEYAQLLYDVLAFNGLVGMADVQSFDPRALEAMHRINPSIRLVWLISNQDGFDANMAKLSFTPAIYSPHQGLVDEQLVSNVHGKGMKIIPWTVNDLGRMTELIDLGVDGFITDYPDRGKALLNEIKP